MSFFQQHVSKFSNAKENMKRKRKGKEKEKITCNTEKNDLFVKCL